MLAFAVKTCYNSAERAHNTTIVHRSLYHNVFGLSNKTFFEIIVTIGGADGHFSQKQQRLPFRKPLLFYSPVISRL